MKSADQSILIVDDNPTNLKVLSEAITSEGFQVSVALDGESALEQMAYHQPALVLLDVMMPGIDGFETCRRMQANPIFQDIPVIFMTALSETEHKVKGLAVGAVDYITKPFQHEEVLARVKVHLRLRHLSQQLEVQNEVLKQFNETLEEKVEQRTAELQQAQIQLIQQEKLSSLGQMVAGVAHEINNPVNFIYGNVVPAQQYVEDLLSLVNLYRSQYPEPNSVIQSALEDLDFDFIAVDLPKLLNSMQVGADRIHDIVRSLRNFSRLDEAERKCVDLHEGIENTLMILSHRLKVQTTQPEIKLLREYGEIPKVVCFPGQLNQVVMNLLANAIDELESKRIAQPEIRIQTELAGADSVRIRIIDNGAGIPETIQQKIFNPFFTTKEVGKGTGLGLSISHQIVVGKHGGNLYCRSTLGQGTEFGIEIPIHQPESDSERLLSCGMQNSAA